MYADEMWFGASIFGMLDISAFPLFLQNVCILRVCMYVHLRVFDFEHAIYFI